MNPEETGGNKKKLIATAAVLVVVVLVVFGVKAFSSNKTKDSSASDQPTSTAQTEQQPASDTTNTSTGTQSTGQYKDGTYTAVGSYQSPGGQEAIKVTVTLANGVVTDSTVTSQTTSEQEAEEYQSMFIGGYKSQVNGKGIDSIHLSRVSGSSLTSGGFNSAISKIKDQAKS